MSLAISDVYISCLGNIRGMLKLHFKVHVTDHLLFLWMSGSNHWVNEVSTWFPLLNRVERA